ncbi:MAG: hypothetical protein CME16_06810 [Gemmatimonadetes bacterium]|nr:hypothetical protein [Gemmatimonadota bacterium]
MRWCQNALLLLSHALDQFLIGFGAKIISLFILGEEIGPKGPSGVKTGHAKKFNEPLKKRQMALDLITQHCPNALFPVNNAKNRGIAHSN